jgi:adenylate cyclase
MNSKWTFPLPLIAGADRLRSICAVAQTFLLSIWLEVALVFSAEKLGLVTAEIELLDENHQIELPPWIGSEVTGQDRYYNGTLAQHPYGSWLHSDAAVAAE